MSSEVQSTLRQAEGNVKLVGYLKEKKLEVKNDKGRNYIAGNIIVSDGENNETSVSYNVSEITTKGEENKTYKGLLTFMNTYVSMAEAMEQGLGKEAVSKVYVGCKFNEYFNTRSNDVKHTLSASFPPSAPKGTFEPYCKFDTEFYLEYIKPEIKNEEETSRYLVGAVIPIYGGKVIKWEFVADQNAGEYMSSNYEIGKTGRIYGDVINTVERVHRVTQGFGGEIDNSFTRYITEYKIVNGEPEQYDEDNNKSYSTVAIRNALLVRENEHEEKRNGGSAPKTAQTGGFASGFASAPTAKKPSTGGFDF